MRASRQPGRFPRPSLSFACLAILLAVLLLAGGSYRGDVMGQVLVRGTAWVLVVVALLFGPRPKESAGLRPVLLLLLAMLAIVLVQLVPLPPTIWQALPGRGIVTEAGRFVGKQPWRPLSLVPGATINAAFSLVVPFAVLLFMAGMEKTERRWTFDLMLVAIVVAMLIGLIQLTGTFLGNPLIDDTDAQVSGVFANRNHFALLLVLGCLLAPVWAFAGRQRRYMRGLVALGLVLLFALTILAVGSRAGLGFCLPAIAIGLLLTHRTIRRALGRAPRWAIPAAIGAGIAMIGLITLVSIASDRAAAIERLLAVDPGQDMRTRGLPVVLAMVREYFPVGAGFGGFDPLFRLHEPFALLKPTYFNHAHNDFVEIVLDAGLPGLLLLAAGLGWWAWASIDTWRTGSGSEGVLPRLGSAILLFVLVGSLFDYPARTPTIMAIGTIAAVWLADRKRSRRGAL